MSFSSYFNNNVYSCGEKKTNKIKTSQCLDSTEMRVPGLERLERRGRASEAAAGAGVEKGESRVIKNTDDSS